MEGEQDIEAPTLAQRFLQQHRPVGIAGDDTGDNDEGIGNDDGAEEPREADGELEVEAPEINGGHNVEGTDESGVPAPPIPYLAPHPRAKGVKHPPVRRERRSRSTHWSNMSITSLGVHTVFRPVRS